MTTAEAAAPAPATDETVGVSAPVGVPDPIAADPEIGTEELQRLEIERLRAEVAALHGKLDHVKDLAEEAEAKRRDWDDLKERAKSAKDDYETALEACAAAARGDVQTEIGEHAEPGTRQTTLDEAIGQPAQAPAPTTGPTLADRLAAGEILEVNDLDWSQVEGAAVSRLVSTGKPPKVRPVEIMGLPYALWDVQDRVAVLLQVLEEAPEGGDAVQVKVGRKVRHLAGLSDALLVRIPPDTALATPAAGAPEADEAGSEEGDDVLFGGDRTGEPATLTPADLPLEDRIASRLREYPALSDGRRGANLEALAAELGCSAEDIEEAAAAPMAPFQAEDSELGRLVVLVEG